MRPWAAAPRPRAARRRMFSSRRAARAPPRTPRRARRPRRRRFQPRAQLVRLLRQPFGGVFAGQRIEGVAGHHHVRDDLVDRARRPGGDRVSTSRANFAVPHDVRDAQSTYISMNNPGSASVSFFVSRRAVDTFDARRLAGRRGSSSPASLRRPTTARRARSRVPRARFADEARSRRGDETPREARRVSRRRPRRVVGVPRARSRRGAAVVADAQDILALEGLATLARTTEPTPRVGVRSDVSAANAPAGSSSAFF